MTENFIGIKIEETVGMSGGPYYIVCDITIKTIYTPNGTEISGNLEDLNEQYYIVDFKCICTEAQFLNIQVKLLNNEPIEGDLIPDPVIVSAIKNSNYQYFSLDDPNREPIYSSCLGSNCHSYAWYSQNLPTNLWLNSPEVYYSTLDASYELVDVANGEEPRIGDIIVYMNGNLANHSGIISGYTNNTVGDNKGNATKYMVTSKWGYGGLYLHKGEECPYYSSATSINYYRLRTDGASEMSISNFKFKGEKQITSRNDIAANGGSKANTYSMYELNVNESGEYTITISAPSPLTISFLDVNRNSFSVTPTITEGNTYVYQFDKYFDEGYYYVRAQFESADASGTIETTVTHKHNYEIYEPISDTLHVKKCVCGASGSTHTHVIKSDGLPKRYKPCIYCGRLIDTESGIIIPSIKNRVV